MVRDIDRKRYLHILITFVLKVKTGTLINFLTIGYVTYSFFILLGIANVN